MIVTIHRIKVSLRRQSESKINSAIAILLIAVLSLTCSRGKNTNTINDEYRPNESSSTDEQKRLEEDRRAREAKVAADRKAFEDYVTQLASDPKLQGTRGGNGYVKGKILIIDREDKKIDSLQDQLPEEMRANKADEVGTVVLVKWDSSVIGYYDNGVAGRVTTCVASVIDNSIPAPVGSKRFRGGRPPDTVTRSTTNYSDVYGEGPDDKVIEYLKSLTRK